MGFKEITSLDTDTTTAIGGTNRKTGKKNPSSAEGYFLGTKQVASPKSKTGFAALHILQTAHGNLGVWGKTDMDRKMQSVVPGTMVRITHSGMQATPNGEMYKFRVEVDPSNIVDVSGLGGEAAEEETQEASGFQDAEELVEEEEAPLDEPVVARAQAPRAPAKAASADRQAAVQALLKNARRS